MKVSLIAAISKNFVIGYKNQIPWHIPADLIWFKKNTINKSIIMGHKTWKSIGKPLSMRQNIVISRKKIEQKGVIWASSISNALIYAQHKEIMIIGGEKIYQQMLFYANKIYLTHIDANFIGDTYFPKYTLYPNWKTVFKKKCQNKKNTLNYYFEIILR